MSLLTREKVQALIKDKKHLFRQRIAIRETQIQVAPQIVLWERTKKDRVHKGEKYKGIILSCK